MKISALIKSTLVGIGSLAFACNTFSGVSYTGSLNETGGGTYLGGIAVGVVVNPTLRNALQAAQIADLGPGCDVGDPEEECMPSITQITLGGVLKASFGDEWGDYGITAFGTGVLASTVVCGTIGGDEATRVAARYVGLGCSTHTPAGLFNSIATLFGIPQNDTIACMTAIENAGAGAIGFVPSDEFDPSYAYIKLDQQKPDRKTFRAGLYPLFGDIHGGVLTGLGAIQIFGDGQAVSNSENLPMHMSAGNNVFSNECAMGTKRHGGGYLSGFYYIGP